MSVCAIQPVILGGVRTYPLASRKSKVTVARDVGVARRFITAANFDFIPHYWPLIDVVNRPTAASNPPKEKASRGFRITGHHEILLPLLAAALAAGQSGRGKSSKR